MIKFIKGNIFESKSQVIVNAVNCEGIMGKGLALQFKKKYPKNYLGYKKACESNKLVIGKIYCYKESNKIIINFPTKDSWRKESKKEYIILGLDKLIGFILKFNVKSISIPPLGCGCGGLKWEDVKEIMINKLSILPEDVKVDIYTPLR